MISQPFHRWCTYNIHLLIYNTLISSVNVFIIFSAREIEYFQLQGFPIQITWLFALLKYINFKTQV